MDYQTILVTTREGITTITLNRPERLNAVNRQMLGELIRALTDVQQDRATRVLVLTGAGRAFCSGADLRDPVGIGGIEMGESPESKRQGLRHGFQPLILAIQRCDVPVIAMVNGDAAASGCDLALACDLRVGSERARFMETFARIGLFPGTGGCWLLPRAVGLAKAAEMIFTGEPLGAEDAFGLGLLSHLIPHEELETVTMALAQKIAAGPPIAIRLAKMVMRKSLGMDLETSLELAAASESITLTSEDHREGLAAFREKRQPVFTGR
jgi:2-(1,2-epoxy-1,2-dihydrophenyl)acetyl-CoA isomerase